MAAAQAKRSVKLKRDPFITWGCRLVIVLSIVTGIVGLILVLRGSQASITFLEFGPLTLNTTNTGIALLGIGLVSFVFVIYVCSQINDADLAIEYALNVERGTPQPTPSSPSLNVRLPYWRRQRIDEEIAKDSDAAYEHIGRADAMREIKRKSGR